MEGRKCPRMPEQQSPGISQIRKNPRMWSMRYAWKYLRYNNQATLHKQAHAQAHRGRLHVGSRHADSQLFRAAEAAQSCVGQPWQLTVPCVIGGGATSHSRLSPSPPSCRWGSPSSGRSGQNSRGVRLHNTQVQGQGQVMCSVCGTGWCLIPSRFPSRTGACQCWPVLMAGIKGLPCSTHLC